MKKTLFILIFAMILLLQNVYSIPPAGVGFNGSFSRVLGDWTAQGGYYEDFSDKTSLNTSIFCNGGSAVITVGSGFLLYSGANFWNVLYTCKQFPPVVAGMCLSFNWSIKTAGTGDSAAYVGFQSAVVAGDNEVAGDDVHIGYRSQIQSSANANGYLSESTPWVGTVSVDTVYNSTLCFVDEGGNTYQWYSSNSDTSNRTYTFGTAPVQNISILGRDTTTEIRVYSLMLFNASKGPPQPAQPSDVTPPIVNTTFNITNPKINDIINFSGNITDETGLLFANWTFNMSGLTKINYSISGTSTQVSNTTKITVSRGNVINFTLYVTDTNNNVKQNSTLFTIADTSGTILIGLNATTGKINSAINASGNCTDSDGDFSVGVISYNISGNPQLNFTFTPSAVGYTLFNFSRTNAINLTRNNIINFTTFCNDTAGTKYQASQLFTVTNTLPLSPTILLPENDKLYNLLPIQINWTAQADSDGDIITAYIYVNGTLNQTTTTNTTLNASDNKYTLNISLFDGVGFSANTTLNSFKIDTTNPIIIMPQNKTINTNTTYIINVSDNNLFGFNCTLYNGTVPANGTLTSVEIVNSSNSAEQINLTLNVSNGDKQYRIACSASDDHTKNKINDYKINKDNNNKFLNFETPTNNISFKILSATAFEVKGDKTKIKDIKTDFIEINAQKLEDRYTIEFNYSNQLSKYTYFEYVINLTSQYKLYPRYSQYKGHFVSREDWIDFEPADYINLEQKSDNNYLVTFGINTTSVKLKSIGGVNVVYSNITLTVDTINPLLNSFNLTNQSWFKNNQTFLGVCTDANIYNFTQKIYGTDSTILNQTHNATANGGTTLQIPTFLDLQNANDGNYTWELNCSDIHTGSGFPDLDFIYRNGNITFYKKNNPQKNVTIETAVLVDGEIKGLSSAQISNFNVNKVIENRSDRINFGAIFDIPSQTSTIFGMKIPKFNDLKLIDENQNTLFMLYDNYWLDFKTYLRLSNGSKFLVATNFLDKTNYYGVYWNITWSDYGLVVGNRTTFITESIGELNRLNMFYNFYVDKTLPSFNHINLTKNNLLAGNNTFISASILNFTYNISETNNQTLVAYISNSKNITSTYFNNATQNLTITFADGNYTLSIEANDTADNKANSTIIGFVVDTRIPTFISAFNRTTSGNSTTITTATSVNFCIEGLDDLYLDRGNFSHNASGTWTNQSITIVGNRTRYCKTIGSGNFTAGQVVGEKFYVYDIAGNELDPIYTFTVGSTPSSPSSPSSGGGITSSITIPQYLSTPFGIEPINGTCSQKQQLLDGRCYDCDSSIGYLEFNPQDRSVVCIQCQSGFELKDKKCVLKTPVYIKDKLNIFIDKYAEKIADGLKANIIVGYILIFVGFSMVVYYGYNWIIKP